MIEAKDLSQRLDLAVTAGVIDRAAADRLSMFLLQPGEAEAQADPDDERLRLITGFNDIFVGIGLALFLGALGYLMVPYGTVAAAAATAAPSWALAEFFTRQRRMALPSIILLLVFAGSVFTAVNALLSDATASSSLIYLGGSPLPLIAAGATMAMAAFLHWQRFQVPITVAAGVAAVAIILVAIVSQVAPDAAIFHPIPVFLPIGLAVFALAMRFDMSDRLRQTRRTDIAFWLHLLAAPIIVHPILISTSGGGTESALIVVSVFLALSFVALVIDRRAVLVSSLGYLAYAAFALVEAVGWASSSAFGVLLVGVIVLLLSAAWRPLRKIVLGLMPDAITTRVPPAAKAL